MTAPQARLTAADYLAFERGSPERHQFVDGEIFAMAGESLAHSTVNANLIISLGAQLRGKPCRVLSPSTEAFDRGERFARYAACLDSFTDCLLVSTASPRLEHFAREAANRWVYTTVEGLDGELILPSLEYRLALAEVYENIFGNPP